MEDALRIPVKIEIAALEPFVSSEFASMTLVELLDVNLGHVSEVDAHLILAKMLNVLLEEYASMEGAQEIAATMFPAGSATVCMDYVQETPVTGSYV